MVRTMTPMLFRRHDCWIALSRGHFTLMLYIINKNNDELLVSWSCNSHPISDRIFKIQGARHAFADSAGRNQANPTAMLLCAANMLKHLKLDKFGSAIKDAVEKTVKAGRVCIKAFDPVFCV